MATAIALGPAAVADVRRYLVWAFGYNAIPLPVATGRSTPLFGSTLSPMLAAAMALSGVSVLLPLLRLYRFRSLAHGTGAPLLRDMPGPAEAGTAGKLRIR